MELLSKAFGVYETNCYILKSKVGDFIIDAGVDSARWVVENAKNPLAILNTHGHFDHIWCNAELRESLKIPIYCPKNDSFMLKSDCFNLGLSPCAPDFEVEPNAVFNFGEIQVEFMHFAGHTPGCSMIKIKEAQSAESSAFFFSGDFIFYRTIGRTDFPYANPKDMAESLKRFGKIDFDATLYPGHGGPTRIKDEQKNVPFYLRGLL